MAVLQWYCPPLIEALNVKNPFPHQVHFKFRNLSLSIVQKQKTIFRDGGVNVLSSRCRCQTETPTFFPQSSDDEYYEDDEDNADGQPENPEPTATSSNGRTPSPPSPPPLMKKRKRYRKAYPGESKGITEEMRFVAMKLRNTKSVSSVSGDEDWNSDSASSSEERDSEDEDGYGSNGNDSAAETVSISWQPSMEGFVKHLVDCKLVFETLERIVEESDDVAYTYFRKTGMERSEGLARDIEWLRERNIEIPDPSNPGVSYAKYLEELSKGSAPSFLTHFYNVYFSHVAGGQVIVKQVSEKLLDGRELEFCKWDGDAQELLKDVRDKLNRLGEHWSRSEKNKCLTEASKSFKYMGQIVRLIIL